jgi:uncharacterized repeat protein (TIGR03803 family)
LTTLYSFCHNRYCSDGMEPAAGLVQGIDGDFYGTTSGGGYPSEMGTVFRITPAGHLTTLYRFCKDGRSTSDPPTYPFQCPDGSVPTAPLIQGTDGNFYGTTSAGGYVDIAYVDCNFFCGTVFKITPQGEHTVLHRFAGHDGYEPIAGLLQGTDGNFYGTTEQGGSCYTCGTVFRLSMGFAPFAGLPESLGKSGQSRNILGQGFTGTTGVFFNGTAATFTIVSDTYIRATVPADATTGFVTVNTPSGTLTSNVQFHVER